MNAQIVKYLDKNSRECMKLIAKLKVLQGALGADGRLELWADLMSGYCCRCGYVHPKTGRCQCQNDE